MAGTKKTTKKTAPKAMTVADMHNELATKRADLLEAKRSHAAGELVNPRALTATRKEIARLLTQIRAAEKESK